MVSGAQGSQLEGTVHGDITVSGARGSQFEGTVHGDVTVSGARGSCSHCVRGSQEAERVEADDPLASFLAA